MENQKNYQEKINQIIEQALTKKTFNLEIVEKIKELKNGFEEAQERIEVLGEDLKNIRKQKDEIAGCLERTLEKLAKLERQEKEVKIERKKQKELQYKLEMADERRLEIKELVSLVFRNPVIVRSKTGTKPNGRDNYGNSIISSVSENERETIE